MPAFLLLHRALRAIQQTLFEIGRLAEKQIARQLILAADIFGRKAHFHPCQLHRPEVNGCMVQNLDWD